ncbi:MAG: COG4705 family protein [Candidatus Saccharimonadales bacterium]
MDTLTRRAFVKVPEITAVFWITKLLTTAMGEATSDFFVFSINPYIAVFLGGVGLAVSLVLQFSVRKYVPWIYWFTVVMVAVFGTMVADVLHIQFGIPYFVTTVFFVIALVAVFVIWHNSEKTLSIHSIYNPRREMFYWATVMATFALGTAAGDMTATTIGLGYLTSSILFSALIMIPAIAYWLFNLNKIAAFWIAYILTRPIGASFADWMSKPKNISGLALGNGHVSLGLTLIIIVFVGYMTFRKTESRLGQTNLTRR